MAGKFPLDLSKFKKVRSDTHTTTLKHPEGHEIRIAHAAVSPKMRSQLASLPTMMAEGGDPMDGGNMADNAAKPQAPVTINIGTPSATPQDGNALDANAKAMDQQPTAPPPAPIMAGAPPAQPPSVPSNVQGTPPPAQSDVQDPYGTKAYGDAFSKGLGEQKAGITQEAAATGAEGQAQAAALQPAIERQQQTLKSYNDHYGELDNERKSFMQDIQHQHIDPKHYMNNMETGQRVTTAIGLILGGIGGGLTHQENPALKFLNSQIDRDIEAQRVNLGKSENLLSANMKQFGNLRDATDMTRVMSMDIVSNQLKSAAAKAMDPLAKARALQAAGKLDMEAAPIVSQIAMRKTLLGGMNSGQIDPARIVNVLIPENQRAEANKELVSAQNMAASRDNLIGAFDQLTKLNTVGNRVTSPIQTPKKVDAIIGPLLAQLSKDSAGRFTEQDAAMLKGLFPAPGDDDKTLQIKRSQMSRFITEKMHYPILSTYGINLSNSGRFTNQGTSRIPESAPIKK